MTVILVLATFSLFILLDWVINRRKMPHAVPTRPTSHISPALEPSFVEGFMVPEQLDYHPGHCWAFQERSNLVRVGADEFAAALAGRVDRIEMPAPGHWLRQGQRAWSLYRDGEKTEMVSPTEGEVVEVNAELAAHPELLRKDPYGKGWLAVIHVPDRESTARNLVPKHMVRTWMREAVGRLYAKQPQLAGEAMADGGLPVDYPLGAIPDAEWKRITAEFFLTA